MISTQHGSESLAADGSEQAVAEAETLVVTNDTGTGVTNVIPRETTYNPTRFQQVRIYSESDRAAPGYNPNEEHAVVAPSLRYAQVSPRPPAIYALRENDLNIYDERSDTEALQPADYTSHPYVLVEYLDTLDNEFKMRVYRVQKEDLNLAATLPEYQFVPDSALTASALPTTLIDEPHVTLQGG